MSKEAMKLALEALENSVDLVSHEARNAEELYGKYPSRLARIQGLVAFEVAHEKAIAALREALAEQPAQQEPVQEQVKIEHCLWARNGNTPCPHTSPPAQRKPLTDEQIDAEFDAFASKFDHESNEWLDMGIDAYFRAGFKAAHGIKENT
jgi:hypothetical protein